MRRSVGSGRVRGMRWITPIALAAALLVTEPLTVGTNFVGAAWAQDHDRARDAVQAGRARPLGEILQSLRGRYPGRLLGARLVQGGGGRLTYKIRILDPEGRVVALTVDAKSGRVMRVRRGGRG